MSTRKRANAKLSSTSTTRKNKQSREREREHRGQLVTAISKTLPSECLIAQLAPFESTLKMNTGDGDPGENIMHDIREALRPAKIKPQNDFYSYINSKWIKEYKIPQKHGYIVQQDDFRIVQDKVYRQLMDLIDDHIKATPHTPQSRAMAAFYKSQHKNCTPAQTHKAFADYIAHLDEANNAWEFMGYICRNEIIAWGSPFVWSLNPDDKEPTVFRCCIDGPQATLIDLDIYFEDLDGTAAEKTYRANYKSRYLKFIGDIFRSALGKSHGFSPKDVFDVEYEILLAMGCDKVRNLKTNPDNYYRISAGAVSMAASEGGGGGGGEGGKYAPFDWGEFARALGFKTTPPFFITSNPNYIKCGAELVTRDWKTPKWRSYWAYVFLRQQQRWGAGHTLFYEFHGKYVRGQSKEIFGNDIKPIYGMGFAFNTFLTNAYIAKYENPAHVQYVKNMAEDLKTVFIRIIERNKWLQPATRRAALKKLHHFNLTVAAPPKLRPDPILDYVENDPWGNLCMIAEWRSGDAVDLEGKAVVDVPAIDWAQIPPKFVGTQAYVVNAAYTPSQNGIYIPLGYIQPPFVDLQERGIEYNLAHIGFTLAHEMSHALDDWGSRYDYLGKLNNWWSPADERHFKRIQNNVIKQYEAFAKMDGIIFDAEPSIGEDLADISGLTICTEYLRDFQSKNGDILPIKALSFEAFFVYFAYQQRQKISKRAIQAQLKSNPHPLDKYRTNVPLSRTPIFRALYNIKRGNKMWWSSTNRVWEDQGN
jgi:predicted metalloendopeptidase